MGDIIGRAGILDVIKEKEKEKEGRRELSTSLCLSLLADYGYNVTSCPTLLRPRLTTSWSCDHSQHFLPLGSSVTLIRKVTNTPQYSDRSQHTVTHAPYAPWAEQKLGGASMILGLG